MNSTNCVGFDLEYGQYNCQKDIGNTRTRHDDYASFPISNGNSTSNNRINTCLEYMDIDEFLSENGIPIQISDNKYNSDKASLTTEDNFSSDLQNFSTSTVSKKSAVRDKGVECDSTINIDVDFKISEKDVELVTVPGLETFDPKARKFSNDELKPQPILKKSKKVFVPDEQKDDKYWSRRRKNNVAARRSREARRRKENQIAMRTCYLEKCNQTLTEEIKKLKEENEQLKKGLRKAPEEMKVLQRIKNILESV